MDQSRFPWPVATGAFLAVFSADWRGSPLGSPRQGRMPLGLLCPGTQSEDRRGPGGRPAPGILHPDEDTQGCG